MLTRQGHAAASGLSPADLQLLLCLPSRTGDAAALFPPEFRFDPELGQPLQAAPAPALQQPWIPAFGHAPQRPSDVSGLRQTAQPLQLTGLAQRQPTDSADHLIRPPAAGDFEFFSVRAGTAVAVLLALEPGKGLLYAWLPASQQWALLTHAQEHLLAYSQQTRGVSWRAEASTDAGGCSRLFVPTEEGLACITPDVPGLAFAVSYAGQVPAIGSPIQWMGQIWAPLRAGAGAVQFVCCDLQGVPGDGVTLDVAALPVHMGAMQTPVADARRAMWLSDAGRLVLNRRTTGGVDAVFLPWPADLAPAFDFGAPYLASNGELWQLCRNAGQRSYEYLSLTSSLEARMPALQPRMSTGGVNFRFAQRQRTAPWEEPEQGHDGAEVEIVLPMVESTASQNILGLRLENTSGLAGMLRSTERMRAALVLDEGTRQTAFFLVNVAMPWRLRWFVHGGVLWAFHAQLQQIHGWELQA
ncbi:MAG: hypothetical protein ABWY08_04545 [Comamonas sp.]